MKDILKRLLETARKNPNGFTVKLETMKSVTDGFSVAYKETQSSFGVEGLKKVITHAEKHQGYVGGWKYGDDYYFDSIMIITDRDEAIRIGRENEQIAIYNLTDGEEIEL